MDSVRSGSQVANINSYNQIAFSKTVLLAQTIERFADWLSRELLHVIGSISGVIELAHLYVHIN